MPVTETLRQQSNGLYDWLWDNRFAVFGIAIVLALATIFSDVVLPLIAVLIMAVIASYSTSYKRVFRAPPAVELVTFTTVIVGIIHGPVWGAIYGAIVTVTAEVLSSAIDVFVLAFVPSRALIGFIAGTVYAWTSGNIILTGILLSVVYNIAAQPMYLFLSDTGMKLKAVYFIALNLIANTVVFVMLGNLVMGLLT